MKRQYRPRRRGAGSPTCAPVESLENRCLLAAHVLGSSSVYSTIQGAVNAAPVGGTITVDAGTYPELVTVNKRLTLRGAEAGNDARSNMWWANPAGQSSVTGSVQSTGLVTSAFYITANDVTIDGFFVQGNTSNNTYGAGIVIAPKVSGTHILDNFISKNVAGIDLANYSSTDQAVIQHNYFYFNNNDGANGGRGIYSDGQVSGGNLTNVLIDGNMFFGNRGANGTTWLEAAIALESRTANSQSNIRITNNVMVQNGKGVLVFNATGIDIENNVVTNVLDVGSGALRFEGGDTNVTIAHNAVIDNQGVGIRIDAKGFAATNSGFVIQYNDLYADGLAGWGNIALAVDTTQYTGSLDARYNWWGDPSGPGGYFTGNGDTVLANGSGINVAPWATSPNRTPRLPFSGVPVDVTATTAVYAFDQGGEGVGYHSDSTSANGLLRPAEGIATFGSTSIGDWFGVGPTLAGQWLAYSVSVPQSGTYRLDLNIASPEQSGTFHVELDGQNVSGPILVPDTGDWYSWQLLSQPNIALAAGQHVLRFVFDSGGSSGQVANFDWFRFVPTGAAALPAAPVGLTATLASASQVNLAWTPGGTNQTGYEIDRSTDGVNFSAVATLSASLTSYSDTGLAGGTAYSYRIRAINAAGPSSPSNVATVATPSATVSTYLSDLNWASATVGWGTIHRDLSIKGNPITLRGTVYPKGIGTHAVSQIVYNLNGQYTNFLSDVGVDDEVGSNGSVIFQVLADGKQIYNSGILTGRGTVQHLNLPVSGIKQLTLVASNGVSGSIDYDHADWAGARVVAMPVPLSVPAAPTNLAVTTASSSQLNLSWSANSTSQTVLQIDRSSDGTHFVTVATVSGAVSNYGDTGLLAGSTYWYRVRATNAAGASPYSNIASGITAASAATFLQADSTTQGSWAGTYGSDGYVVFGGASNSPSYAQLAASGQGEWTWASSTTDPRAMQTGSGSSSRVASCYYSSTSFSLNLNLTDGRAHRVALYMLDWDYYGRSQTVTVSDANTGAILDTRMVSAFAGGQWLVWNLTGQVRITLTCTGPGNCVASGLMFG